MGPQCLAYMDDIINFSETAEQHLKTIDTVLLKLSQAGIKLKIKKCHFFAKNIKFLGYNVSSDGMTMCPERVNAINSMPSPTNKKKLQAFLGTINYFRMFVSNFAQLAEPLYKLLRKDVPFCWSAEQEEAVKLLKHSLSKAPIMKFPDFSLDFHVHTDASIDGIGATLSQKIKGNLHPLAYVSKTLNDRQKRYSTTKKEALAVVYALEEFRHIILNYPIHVYTDHKPLLGALTKPTKDDCLLRWSLLIQEYKVNFHYLEGKDNIVADTLSRLPVAFDSGEDIDTKLKSELDRRIEYCRTLNEYIPAKFPWNETDLENAQSKDKMCVAIIKQLRANNDSGKNLVPPNILINCKIIKGILYVLRQIRRGTVTDEFLVPYVPDSLMQDAFKLMHNESTAGHKAVDRTLKLFVRNFYNYQEKTEIEKLCKLCEMCIKAKSVPRTVPISKYPVPIRPFHTISSDILGPLRLTEEGHQYVLTIRDFTTRYTILFPLQHKTSDDIIDALRSVISHYGGSVTLLSDNTQEYKSERMNKFLSYYNTKKVEIAPHHPASQGLSEKINREITKLLRIYCTEYALNDWSKLLPVLQLTINNTFNSSIKETPFYALFGFDSGTVTLNPPKLTYSEDELQQHMYRVAQIRRQCHASLLQAQSRYTEYTNLGRKKKAIALGDRVYAKMDKYHTKYKLDLPVSGPFVVTGSKGKAWELTEAASGKTYIVHPDYIIEASTPTLEPETEPESEPEPPDSPKKVKDEVEEDINYGPQWPDNQQQTPPASLVRDTGGKVI